MTLEYALIAVVVILSIALAAINARRRYWKKAYEYYSTTKYADFADAAQRADFQKRRADEFFGIIQGIETERDIWRRFYEKTSHHAGVAQAWLLRDLAAAVQAANAYAGQLRKLGQRAVDVQINPALSEVVQEFGLNQEKAKDIKPAPGFSAAKEAEARFEAETVSSEKGP